MGVVKLGEQNSKMEIINVITPVLNSQYAFSSIDISVSTVSGLSFVLTDMNSKYYNFISILHGSIVFLIILLTNNK